MTFDERKSILCKPCLSSKDIMVMEECKDQNAQRIMSVCREVYQGSVFANKHRITTESYLQYCGCPKGTWLEIVKGKGETL